MSILVSEPLNMIASIILGRRRRRKPQAFEPEVRKAKSRKTRLLFAFAPEAKKGRWRT